MTVHLPDLLRRHQASMLIDLQRRDLFSFVHGVFLELDGGRGGSFHPNWHVQAMCHALQRVAAEDGGRLLITVPLRHLKTICTAIALPAWLLGHDPGTQILVASYGHDLSGASLAALRRVMESDFYRRVFPQTRITSAHAGEIRTSAGGKVKAVSVGGAVTGHGADYIIVDDLMKAGEASSPTVRQSTKDFYEGSLATRLNNKSKGCIIAIQQRLHEDDLAAHMIAQGSFEHLNLRAIAEEDETIAIGKGRFHHRRKGEALFPQHEPLEVLERTRRDLGPFMFASQYQQNPVAPGGNRIRWEHWGTYEAPLAIDDYQLRVQSWDLGMSAEPTSDYCACTTWGYREGNWHLLEVYRDRLEYSDQKKQVLARMKRFRADKVIIEKAATGIPLIRELRREERLRDKVHGYQPVAGKEVRVESQIAKLETGKFLLPEKADWLAEFKHECQAFPNGKHDDMVDSLTQFLDWLGMRPGMGTIRRAEGRDPPRRP